MQLLTSLVDKIQRSAVLYYVQRHPEILESFVWTLDAKNENPTEYEMLWQKVVCNFLQSSTLSSPAVADEDFDYSYMNKFLMNIPENLKEQAKLKRINHKGQGFSLKKIMKNTTLENSKNSLGLQLADIIITTVRRACNGNLQKKGWNNLGKLTIQRSVEEVSTFDLVTLSNASIATRQYFDFIKTIDAKSKRMLV